MIETSTFVGMSETQARAVAAEAGLKVVVNTVAPSTSTAFTAATLLEQAAQIRAEAEQARQRLEFEYAFLRLDRADRLEADRCGPRPKPLAG